MAERGGAQGGWPVSEESKEAAEQLEVDVYVETTEVELERETASVDTALLEKIEKLDHAGPDVTLTEVGELIMKARENWGTEGKDIGVAMVPPVKPEENRHVAILKGIGGALDVNKMQKYVQ